jgi:hypothetical protein
MLISISSPCGILKKRGDDSMKKKTKGILLGFLPFTAYLIGFGTLIYKELRKHKE